LYQANFLRFGVLGALFAVMFAYYRNESSDAAALQQVELDHARLDAQMGEARLLVLQAQIEPHFLFNTLAHVRRLYQTEPKAARAMLDDLMRYLTVALPQMRERDSTVGRETTLAEAYLNIQRIRMGRRLSFEISFPDSLRHARMPSMMLLTLIENAVKHGLGPLPEGGFIRIDANADSGSLEVKVADTGRGFTSASGTGTGLANIRARLVAVYGNRGRLSLKPNVPRGVTASIAVPLTIAATPAGSR
jgi:LytS/YehU family sensor histidine kinase